MLNEVIGGTLLAAFVAFIGLLHVAAIALATRSRESQRRHPRYWGR